MEDLWANGFLCPKVTQYFQDFINSTIYKDHNQTVRYPLQVKVANALNIPVDHVDIGTCFDCWASYVCHGYTLPNGITDDIADQVITENEWQEENSYMYPNRLDFSKVAIGLYLTEYLNVLRIEKNNPNTTLNFILYSAHDTTLMPILNALDIWDGKWTTYASSLITEYYEGQFVRIIFNGKAVIVPGCGQEFCPFDTFDQIVSKALPGPNDCQSSHTFGNLGYNIHP